MDVDALAHEAAQLSTADQHALLDRIVDALTIRAERQVAEAWDEEIGLRVRDLDSGAVEAVPWAELKDRLHTRRTSAGALVSSCNRTADYGTWGGCTHHTITTRPAACAPYLP